MTLPFRFLPVALPLLLGCSAGRGASGAAQPAPDDERTMVIQVSNNMTPRAAVTVLVQRVPGGRTVLGSVPPGGIRELRFTETVFTSSYQLTASRPDGSAVTSEAFRLFPKALVTWSLKNNVLQVSER